MVLYGCVLHLIWAAALWASDTAVNGTAMNALYVVFGSTRVLFVALILVATSAAIGAVFKSKHSFWFLLLPQQTFLLISAAGAFSAMWLGHFADGVARSQAFIVSDQIYPILTAVGHSIALLAYFHRSGSND